MSAKELRFRGRINVPRRVLDMLTSDPFWNAKLEHAKDVTGKEQVLIGFCHARGIVLHHDIAAGRLVMARV
jgi:hypothetical protein